MNYEVGLKGRLAENLFDRGYLIDAENVRGSFGIPTYIAGDPRRFRVQAGVRW